MFRKGAAGCALEPRLEVGNMASSVGGALADLFPNVSDRLKACEAWARDWLDKQLPTCAPESVVVDVTGRFEGMQAGDHRAPNGMLAICAENYSGMDRSSLFQRARTQAAIGADSVDVYVANPLWPVRPGDVPDSLTLTRGDEIVAIVDVGYQRKVPKQGIWEMYVEIRMQVWSSIMASGSDAYQQDHADYSYFQAMASVVMLRYRLLLALARVLVVEHYLEWGVAWRVLCTQITEDFARHLLHHQSPTDCELYRVLSTPLACHADRIVSLARGRAEVLGHTVARAQADADAEA
jgi:hypothetical protein